MSNTNAINNVQIAHFQQTAPVAKPTADAGVAKGTGSSGPVATKSSANDEAKLSATSTLLAAALKVSDVRTEKVAGLQQAIAAGTYHVASHAVADKLLQSLLG